MSNRIPPEKQKILVDILLKGWVKYRQAKGEPVPDELLELAGMKPDPESVESET